MCIHQPGVRNRMQCRPGLPGLVCEGPNLRCPGRQYNGGQRWGLPVGVVGQGPLCNSTLSVASEGWPVGGSSLVFLVGRTWLVVQLEGLGDGCQHLRNSFSANLIFSSSVSSSYPRGKGLDKCKLFWFGEVLEKGVTESKEDNEMGPVTPELFSGFASLSRSTTPWVVALDAARHKSMRRSLC
jgi:hypothetical protein